MADKHITSMNYHRAEQQGSSSMGPLPFKGGEGVTLIIENHQPGLPWWCSG